MMNVRLKLRESRFAHQSAIDLMNAANAKAAHYNDRTSKVFLKQLNYGTSPIFSDAEYRYNRAIRRSWGYLKPRDK